MLSEIAKRVIDLAVTAPSADNSQPWQFVQHSDHWEVIYHHTGSIDLFGRSSHATLLSTGCLNYNLEQICGRSNTSSFVDHHGNWRLSFVLPDEISKTTESVLFQRHTNRHPFIGPIPNFSIDQIADNDQIKLQLIVEPTSIRQICKAIKICSELRFHNQELHQWLFSSLRWTPSELAVGDGLDLNTLHLPPGGNAIMKFISSWHRMTILNSLGVSKLMAHIDSLPVRNAPALMVISGKHDPALTWQAGKTLAEIWTKLNQIGIAVHPYYVITDIAHRLQDNKLANVAGLPAKKAVSISREVLNLKDDELPHIVLRIGLPTISPVRSKRKKTEAFINEYSSEKLHT